MAGKKLKTKIEYRYILGIDIGGATRMGVALFDNQEKRLIEHHTIRARDSKTTLQHRMKLVELIKDIQSRQQIDILLMESIRLFAGGKIALATILSLNKVHTTLINEFSDDFPIYQIDVRSWKSRVLGNANLGKDESIAFVHRKYPEVNLLDEIHKPRKKETILELNADLADSICISECLKFDYSILQNKNKLNYK